MDGIYVGYFAGEAGNGLAMFVFREGVIVGVDANGTSFDGTYELIGDACRLQVEVTIPPGGLTVQGVAVGDQSLTYSVETVMPVDVSRLPYLTLPTPYGNVNVRLKKLRDA
jgi:hypothetical protein